MRIKGKGEQRNLRQRKLLEKKGKRKKTCGLENIKRETGEDIGTRKPKK